MFFNETFDAVNSQSAKELLNTADWNIDSKFVQLATSHEDKSWLNASESLNMKERLVTDDTSHDDMS
jgi:hypothetical protein